MWKVTAKSALGRPIEERTIELVNGQGFPLVLLQMGNIGQGMVVLASYNTIL
jgi:hypothetical protein